MRRNRLADVLLEDVGRRVLYIPHHVTELYDGDTSHPDVERGVIASRQLSCCPTGNTVAVRYDGDVNPKMTPLACLEFEVEVD